MNRFDKPRGQEYVSTRVPLPLDFIAGMAKDYSTEYKKTKDEVYALDDLMSKVNAIDEHSQYKKQLNDQFHPRIEDLASRMAKGVDLNTATAEINKLKRDFQNNELRQELENSYANKSLYQKKRIELGDKYATWQDPNAKFTGSKDNQLNPFRFQGMGERQDHAEEARKQMADIAKNGWDIKNTQLGEDGNIYTKNSKGEYVKDARVSYLADIKTRSYKQTKQGEDYYKMISEQYPNATPEQLDKEVKRYLYTAGQNQVFQNTGSGNDIDVTGLSLRKYDEAQAAKEFNQLSTTEGAQNTTPINNGGALTILGATPGLFDDDGNVNYKNGKIVGGFGRLHIVGNTPENQNLANQAYSELIQIANNAGFDMKKYKVNNKTDYDALKRDLIEYGKNVGKETSIVHNLQKDFQDNLSTNVFGEYVDGKLKKSGNMQGITMYENNNPNNKLTDEKKAELAKNAKFIGIDFNDPNLGALMFTATGDDEDISKSYNAVLPNDVLKNQMKPVHELTQNFKRAKSGKIDLKESKENIEYSSNLISTIATNVLNSGDPNGQQKATAILELGNTINKVDNNTRIVTGTNPRNNTVYIGKIVKLPNGKSTEEMFEVDNRGNIRGPLPLGTIQHEESSEIQKSLSSGFDAASERVDPKNVDYR